MVSLLGGTEAEDAASDSLLIRSKSEVGCLLRELERAIKEAIIGLEIFLGDTKKEFTEVEQRQANLIGDSQGGAVYFYSSLLTGL